MNSSEFSIELNLIREASEAAARLAERVAAERIRITGEKDGLSQHAALHSDLARACFKPSNTYRDKSTGTWHLAPHLRKLLEGTPMLEQAELDLAVKNWSDFRQEVRDTLEAIRDEREISET